MFRRSLVVLIALVLAGLAVTAGYALLHFRGATDVLAEAQALVNRGDNTGAVRLLDLCERGVGLQKSPELRHKVWRMRMECSMRLSNLARALDDTERLIADKDPDEGLVLQRIYLLAATGNGTAAKQRALEFLKDNPTSARGLELAGEACQVEYRERLTNANEQLRMDLEYELYEPARDAMLAYLYRPAGDPSVTEALLDLQRYYERRPSRRQLWIRTRDSLKDLRDRIQQGLDNFQRALELATPDAEQRKQFYIAAYRGVSFALQQGSRRDSVIAQAGIYRSHFEHQFSIEAAVDAANANLDDQLWRAAIATCDGFLPPDQLRARIQAGHYDANSLMSLLEAKALALYRLGNHEALIAQALELGALVQSGAPIWRAFHTTFGLGLSLEGNNLSEALAHLQAACDIWLPTPMPVNGPDFLQVLMPLRLELMRKLGNPTDAMLGAIGAWAPQRPASTAPLSERTRVLLGAGQANAAMASAADLLQKEPRDDEALRMLADAAKATYADSGQDGPGLLAQCLSRNVLRPDVPHPVCLLLCGETALAQGQLAIARECGRIAADEFPLARWPRHLQAKALIAGAGWAEAAQALDRWLSTDPDDAAAIQLWFESCRKQGLPVDQHLRDVVRLGIHEQGVTTALLRQALQGQTDAAQVLATGVLERSEKETLDTELLALAAQALARSDATAAGKLLDRALSGAVAPFAPSTANALAAATMELLVTKASALSDADLQALAVAELQRPFLGPEFTDALVATARRLADRERPRAAYELVAAALTMPGAEDRRTGDAHLLAGRLALRLGNLDRARHHLTAAVSFDDGAPGSDTLTRMMLLAGEQGRATVAYRLGDEHRDPVLTFLFGARADALAQALPMAAANPGELGAQVVCLLGVPEGQDLASVLDEKRLADLGPLAKQVQKAPFGADLRAATGVQRRLVLELITALEEPQLAATALPRIRALIQALPDSVTLQLLQARALAQAGKAAEAAKLHGDLLVKGFAHPVLFTEAVRCTKLPGYTLAEPIAKTLRGIAQKQRDALTPELAAYAIRSLAGEALAAGQAEAATALLADLWVAHPIASAATVHDALTLADRKRLPDAIRLLTRLRDQGSAELRVAASAALFGLAAERGTGDPALAEQVLTDAKQQLAGNGPLGPPLRFLLADPTRLEGIDAADLQRWLRTVVLQAAAGEENLQFGLRALAACDQRFGRTQSLSLLEEAIAAHPEAAELWIQRARYLAQARRGAEGIAEAKNALDFGARPDLLLELLTLAAQERCVTPLDTERAARLPKAMLDSPLGCYLRGLLHLRQGQPKDAVRLLAAAEPRADGFHLFARALAATEVGDPASLTLAKDLFTRFEQQFAANALASNAASFARQLAAN